jgi:PAS domain S-box-containing protein
MDQLYLYAIKHCPIPISIFDRDMHFVEVSDRYLTYNRLQSDDIIGKSIYEVFPELPQKLKDMHQAVLAGKVETATEDRYVWPDGSIDYKRWECWPWKDQNGQINGVIIYTEFITDKKKVEIAFAESERQLITLMANLPGMAYKSSGDANRTMSFVSNGCLELTGYPSSKLIHNAELTFQDLVNQEDFQSQINVIEQGIAQKGSYRISYRIKTANNEEKWVLDKGIGIYSNEGLLIGTEGFITDITENKKQELSLQSEYKKLKSSIGERYRFGNIIGKSGLMQELYQQIIEAAASNASVLLLGESGTGKELAALAIHKNSDRHHKPFIPVNCSAIPSGLIESEFFGHKKGAFTGAQFNTRGYLHAANKGVLFMDEVGDIDLHTQVKLLRVLESGEYAPIGETTSQTSNFRLICATNKDPADLIKHKAMRLDFFYRIGVIPIVIPPLRERIEDIPLLADHFFKQLGNGKKYKKLSGLQLDQLISHSWTGNVRELQNVLHRFVTTGEIRFLQISRSEPENRIQPETTFLPLPQPAIKATGKIDDLEREHLIEVLNQERWNRTKAAEILGISRRALYRKIDKHQLK